MIYMYHNAYFYLCYISFDEFEGDKMVWLPLDVTKELRRRQVHKLPSRYSFLKKVIHKKMI